MIAPLKVFFFWEGDQAYRRSHDLESPENGQKGERMSPPLLHEGL